MNSKKICFIMCSNDEDLANECLLYIEQLRVPDGFEIETLVVRDAASMCAGYNEAMRTSDAKYKIYLHQDVLLLYRGILENIVSLFERHPEVGMLGVVGSTSLAADGCQWSDGLHRRVGELLGDLVDHTTYSMFGKAEGEYQPVLVLDGLFMATQYDIPWREDLFEGWDFYDSSQSIEFWKAGYQVVVPHMNMPWCLHDNDIMHLESYEKWRVVFEREYGDLYRSWDGSGAFLNKSKLNENKIAFIICYNNEMYLNECTRYISFLDVPDGMETDIISVYEAESMCAGYNAAMQSSDAKYKVYLHQDVFIVNKNFISEVVEVFRKNPEYGLFGVLGADRQSSDGVYWDKWSIGATYACNSANSVVLNVDNPDNVREAVAVDGMLMITQYDVPWNETVFDGFDFYDISQCVEFIKAGYRVGVPHQESIWCMHDCGYSNLRRYNHYRALFCKEYAEYGYAYADNEGVDVHVDKNEHISNVLPHLQSLLEAGYVAEALNNIDDIMKLYSYNMRLCVLQKLCNILLLEQALSNDGGFGSFLDIEEMLHVLSLSKFLLWRIEFGKSVDDFGELLNWIERQGDKGKVMLELLAESYSLCMDKVLDDVAKIF